jgi:hypothetical protein
VVEKVVAVNTRHIRLRGERAIELRRIQPTMDSRRDKASPGAVSIAFYARNDIIREWLDWHSPAEYRGEDSRLLSPCHRLEQANAPARWCFPESFAAPRIVVASRRICELAGRR